MTFVTVGDPVGTEAFAELLQHCLRFFCIEELIRLSHPAEKVANDSLWYRCMRSLIVSFLAVSAAVHTCKHKFCSGVIVACNCPLQPFTNSH